MSQTVPHLVRRRAPPTLRVRVGKWFEANATGWAVLVVPLLLALVVAVLAVAPRLT